jgi:hypothetical protein
MTISTQSNFYNHRLQEVGRVTNYSTNHCYTRLLYLKCFRFYSNENRYYSTHTSQIHLTYLFGRFCNRVHLVILFELAKSINVKNNINCLFNQQNRIYKKNLHQKTNEHLELILDFSHC